MVPCPRCQFPLCGNASCLRSDDARAASASTHHTEEECEAFAASGFKPKILDLDLPHFLYQAKFLPPQPRVLVKGPKDLW